MNHHDPLDDLGRELRRRVGHEFRAEAEDMERDAASAARRRQTLGDVAVEMVNRGDSVSVVAGSKGIRGTMVYARGRLAILDTPAGKVDINLDGQVVLRIDERDPSGGQATRRGSETIRSRLLEHELEGNRLAIWVPSNDAEVEGHIVAVGRDHLKIEDGGVEWTLPLIAIAWVRAL